MLPAAQASNKAAKSKFKPTLEQIEALRAARAQKKEDENRKAELAEAAAREAARERAARGEIPVDPNTGKPLYVGRSWAEIARPTDAPEAAQQRKVRILSWNILAQGLIQRKLFPGSDALKWKDRSPGLGAELVGHAYDVGCFQEVDRFEVHSTALRHHGYAYEYQRGYRVKKHGLAIVWRTIARPGSPGAVFAAEPAGRALLYLDHASVSDGDSTDESGRRRTACSRETRNIALFVAIRFADRKGGLIVATTHTFWHPKHGYERARQVGLIIRELDKFRRRKGAEWQDWDCVLAGDFNDQPDSATYELSTARGALRDVAIEEVSSSMVVHTSIDEKINYDGRHHERPQALVAITTPLGAVDGVGVEAQTKKAPSSSPDGGTADSKETPGEATEDALARGDGPEDDGEAEEEEEGEAEGEAEEHQDRILKNCRPARPSDGLLTLDELCQLYDLSRPPPSSEGGYDPNTHPDARSTLTTRTASSASSPIGLQSTYGSFYNRLKAQGEEQAQEEADGLEAGNFFGSASRGRERWNDDTWTPDSPNSHLGDGHEPMWTLFSPLFSLTLDYIFLFPRISGASSGEQEGGAGESGAAASYPKVTALLRTHRTEVLQPGTPRKFVNASDHVAIGAEIEL